MYHWQIMTDILLAKIPMYISTRHKFMQKSIKKCCVNGKVKLELEICFELLLIWMLYRCHITHLNAIVPIQHKWHVM